MLHLHFATIGHIFEALPGAQIMYTISHFESLEVRSPELQMVCDLEVKRRSYGRLKTTMQTMSGNVTAASHFATVGSILEHLLELK